MFMDLDAYTKIVLKIYTFFKYSGNKDSETFFFEVYFSCNVNSQINGNPKLPVLRYDDDGNLESSISPRIVGGTEAAAGEFQGKV